MFHNFQWTAAEKKQARQVFELALQNELAEILASFKKKSAAATTADQMWGIAEFVARKRRGIEEKYDYRYSQLIPVFGRLLREGRITEEQLDMLADEKMAYILKFASL
jgi:hypothetical protein